MYGWIGKYAVVDLSKGKVSIEDCKSYELRAFIGGRGIGVKVCFESIPKGVSAFSEDNVVVFSSGPVNGTIVPMSGKCIASSKSPLTGGIFDTCASGKHSFHMKSCGFDFIVIRGRASDPVEIVVREKEIEIIRSSCWGLDTESTIRHLIEHYGDCSVACIGPAGENLVRFASVVCEDGGVFGRCGLGAVLGAKNVKAIVFTHGDCEVEVYDTEDLCNILENMMLRISWSPALGKVFPRFGTSCLFSVVNFHGALPARNFREKALDLDDKIGGDIYNRRFVRGRFSCFMCPVACKRVVKVDGRLIKGPEFESIWSIGCNCDVHDLGKLIEVNDRCLRLGLDTISFGGVVACFIEMVERGIVRENVPDILDLVEMVAYRRGIGDKLAEGSLRFARSYGAEKFAMQSKGLELPAYDPREAMGQALAYATSNRGGCHLRAYMVANEILGIPTLIDRKNILGKADLVMVHENSSAFVDSMVMCRFSMLEFDDLVYARILSAVTGVEYGRKDVQLIGERIWNLERLFNVREGIIGDGLPERILKTVPLEAMLRDYYEARGWSENGIPKIETLRRLGLDEYFKG